MIKSITLISAQKRTLIDVYFGILTSLNKDYSKFSFHNDLNDVPKSCNEIVIWDNPTRDMPIAEIQPWLFQFHDMLEDSEKKHDLYVYSNHPEVINFCGRRNNLKVISVQDKGSDDVTESVMRGTLALDELFARGWEIPIEKV